MVKPRTYKTEAGVNRRLKHLRKLYPNKSFYSVPTFGFRYAVALYEGGNFRALCA